MFDEVKEFVKKSFEGSASGDSLKHFERTVYWAEKLRPDSDEAIFIAAYAHDIARAFRKTNTEETFKIKEFNDSEILKEHQNRGAKIIADFLERNNYDGGKIKRIVNIIRKHEVGGDGESDLIKDADSISYLEINAPRHINKLVHKIGKDKVKRKIDWMFNRISSEKARNIAKPFYEKVISDLTKRALDKFVK